MSEAGRSCNETILYPATKAYTRYGGGSEYHDSRSHSKVLKSSPNISVLLSISLSLSLTIFLFHLRNVFISFNLFP